MERLGALYHWSPQDRRKQIQRHGLRPRMRPTVTSNTFRQPHVCLGPTPAMAWALSGGMPWAPRGLWDLWQVRLAEDDPVRVRPLHGTIVEEVQVLRRIPKRQLWWVGSRDG